jgi:hypothetical protein
MRNREMQIRQKWKSSKPIRMPGMKYGGILRNTRLELFPLMKEWK